MYRAMSYMEYESTGGFLTDLKNSGEGPHVRADVSYLENANFINTGEYDVIVKYDISLEAFAAFNSTPYKYTPGTGKGGPVFDAARNAGIPYMKLEKGVSYGFPGLQATQLFNASIHGAPQIYSKIKR